MKTLSRCTLALLLSTLLLGGATARAQYTGANGTQWNNMMSAGISVYLQNSMNQQMLRTSLMSGMVSQNIMQQSLSRKGLKFTRSRAEQKKIDAFAKYRGTMFKAGRSTAPAKVARVFVKNSGAQQRQMTQFMAALLQIYNERSKQQKAPPNDLARTLSYCIALNYAYHTEQDVSHKGLDTLRAKIRAALINDPKFRAMSDAKKQELSDTMVILSHFAALGYDHSKSRSDQNGMKAFKKFAGINLQAILGVEPTRIKLEKTGLVITPKA